MKIIKCSKAGSAMVKPIPFRRLPTTPTLCYKPTLNHSTSTTRTGAASNARRHEPVFRLKSAGLLPQLRQNSSSALNGHGELNRTALHELHIRNGGKMVAFGGYSMPVQYSDLSVGESHAWTREKASLFDVGHM